MDIRDPRYKDIHNLPNEQWKPVKGFEDEYEVSSEGRVRSKDRYIVAKDMSTRYVPEKILTPTIITKKNSVIYAVSLASGGRDKHHYCRSVKNLVAEAFLEKDPNCLHLVTIDNPYDFQADNLLYISAEEVKSLRNQ